MTNAEFARIRREAEITSAELADYMGVSRRHMLRVETGREPVSTSYIACLRQMIAERQAA